MEVAFVIKSRIDFFAFAIELIEHIPQSVLSDPQDPLDIAVNGTRNSGKRIFFEVAAETLLGKTFDIETVRNKEHTSHIGVVEINRRLKDNRETHEDLEIFHSDLMDASDDYVKSLLRLFPYPHMADRRGYVEYTLEKIKKIKEDRNKGGLNFWQNAEIPTLWSDDMGNEIVSQFGLILCVKAQDPDMLLIGQPYKFLKRVELWKLGLGKIFDEVTRQSKFNSTCEEYSSQTWSRVIRMKITDSRLTSDINFMNFIYSLQNARIYEPSAQKALTYYAYTD